MLKRSATVTYEVVDGQAVLVHPDGREMLTLNALGTRVWEALDGTKDEEAIVASLSAEFPDVDRSQIVEDVGAFIAELRRSKLLEDAG
jgi:hypothetical protein